MLTDRFSDALTYAERLHRAQTRKGNDIPYVAHLLAVAAVVLEWGGDEDTAIAALLHDAVEDQGGAETLAEITRRFGDRVAAMVVACSDSVTTSKQEKAPWAERKRKHLAKLAEAGPEVALISAADKLHNLGAMIRDVRRDGVETMRRFNASPADTVWYYASVGRALARYRAQAPVDEIEAATAELADLLGLEVP